MQPMNRIAIRVSRHGVSTFPSLSVSLSGFKATRNAMVKNRHEYSSWAVPAGIRPSRNGITAISNDVLAVRGIARHGPIDK